MKAHKTLVLDDEKETRTQRDFYDRQCRQSRSAYQNLRKQEQEIRKKRGKEQKSVRKIIEEILIKNKTPLSSYHGGDMEGNDIRRLMHEGPAIFSALKNAIVEYCASGSIRVNDEDYASQAEIEPICSDYGQLLLLMDAVFSLLNTKRGEVTADTLQRLEERLKTLMQEWNRFQLSITPKAHILFNHSLFFLMITQGFHDMGEDRVERAHQERMRCESRLMRLRNISSKMLSQAKFQN